MNSYFYKALDADGTVIRGLVEGHDASSAEQMLTARGLFVVRIRKSSRYLKKITDVLPTWRISRKEIIEFSSNLSVMIRGGVPIIAALEDIISTITNQHLKSTITDVKKNTEMGIKLSDALNQHPGVFPDIMIRLVRVGEETGRLENSLSEVASHLQKLEDLAATVKRAMIYPLFSLITTGIAVVFWLAYVLPKVMNVLIDSGVAMPLLTKILYEVSKMTEKYWYLFLLIPVFIFIIIQVIKLNPVTRYYWDFTKIKLPLIRLLVHNKLLALLSEQLRLLIVAGITIDRSLDVAADVMGNEVFKQAIQKSKEDITAGNKIFEALSLHGVFPPLFIRMVAIGESSGNLDKQFGFLADHYYKIVDDLSEKIGKMIEPILIILLGLIMGLMVAGVVLPMYDVFSKLSA
ncbi:MAG: type II secretion system F family protein [Deltaproteobacteria bacterium]|nr:type II secretion system F family protein [Deltaproteobacteria bacterium]